MAFFSLASNLVANDTNGVNDVFVKDRESGAVARVSVDAGIELWIAGEALALTKIAPPQP